LHNISELISFQSDRLIIDSVPTHFPVSVISYDIIFG